MKTLFAIFIGVVTAQVYAQSSGWVTTGIRDSVIGVTAAGDNIITATQNNGIRIFNKVSGAITTYNMQNSILKTNDFRSVSFIDGKIYAGAFNDGMYILENNNWIHYDTLNSALPGNSVTDFAYDAINARVLIATDKGLVSLQDDNWTIMDSINSPLPGNKITCLYLDDANRLWIGTRYAGMAKLEAGNWEIFNYNNSGINDNYIRTITADDNGYLYVADYFGVDKYEIATDTWVFVFNTFTSPITSDRVNKMGFDAHGNFWLATHYGVTLADSSNTWTQFYAENSGLPHNTCDGLSLDDEGIVWVGTYGGLAGFMQEDEQGNFAENIRIFPNPCTDHIIISGYTVSSFRIFTSTGVSLIPMLTAIDAYGESQTKIDVSRLQKGTYFILIDNGSGISACPFVKL